MDQGDPNSELGNGQEEWGAGTIEAIAVFGGRPGREDKKWAKGELSGIRRDPVQA